MIGNDLFALINTLATLLSAVGTCLGAFVVAVTLLFMMKQTDLTRKSVQQIEKQIQSETKARMNTHLSSINDILLRDEDLAKLYGFNKADVLAFSLLDNLSMRYRGRKDGIIDDIGWVANKHFVVDVMKREFVRRTWEKIKGEYDPEFVQFINEIIWNLESVQTPQGTDKQSAEGKESA